MIMNLRKAPTLRALALCTTAAIAVVQDGVYHAATAQEMSQELDLNIPAQALSAALTQLADQSGMGLVVSSQVVAGKRSAPVTGRHTVHSAFSRMLSGTGLAYVINGTTVLIESTGAGEANLEGVLPDGSVLLDPITVDAGRREEAIYSTPSSTAYISNEDLERFRGSSPADMFRGTPGVMSGEARNGAGAVDVNIRGMQGMGRVATTVDGAENSVQVYQGYQGISNRTFVDPDLISGIEITKGADIASGGIAGSVAMRTVGADDIVAEGQTFGIRLKTEAGSNTSTPHAGRTAGYAFSNVLGEAGTVSSSQDGMDRPDLLEPTQGSASVVAAMKTEAVDLLLGYAYRKRGNYHAGSNGKTAEPEWIGGVGTSTGLYTDYVQNSGLLNYREGEEVLNSELETRSLIAKGTLRFGDGHSLQYGFNRFRSEAGDFLARRLTSKNSRAQQSEQTTGTRLDSHTLKYRLNPVGNPMVDLEANLWISRLETLHPPRWGVGDPEDFGLPSDYRVGSDTTMWGLDLSNRSEITSTFGTLDLHYGLSYKNEDVRPRPFYVEIENAAGRDAEREQISAFATASYQPNLWLTFNGGLRYDYFESKERRDDVSDYEQSLRNGETSLSDAGLSPFLGLTIEPWLGTQIFVNYSNAMRLPSLFESSSSYVTVNDDIQPERSRNWEVGINHVQDGIFTGSDRGMVKLSFFDWQVKDYISRSLRTDEDNITSLQMSNIDHAHFQGLELAMQYENAGFFAEMAANYSTSVEFCRSAVSCANETLAADYATNQIPPEYTISLTLSQDLLDDALNIGGRVTRVGPRASGHGDPVSGLSTLIALVDWEPYTLIDAFAEYDLSDHLQLSFRIENLTDTFYVDPISVVAMPGPGRTAYAGLSAKF